MSAMSSRTVFPDALRFVSPPVASRSAPGRRTVTATASLPEGGAQVPLSPISDQHDDTARLFPRDREPRSDGGAPRDAAEDPFFAREPSRHRDGLVGARHAVLVRHRLVP